MGEAKRRKQILGDRYGQQRFLFQIRGSVEAGHKKGHGIFLIIKDVQPDLKEGKECLGIEIRTYRSYQSAYSNLKKIKKYVASFEAKEGGVRKNIQGFVDQIARLIDLLDKSNIEKSEATDDLFWFVDSEKGQHHVTFDMSLSTDYIKARLEKAMNGKNEYIGHIFSDYREAALLSDYLNDGGEGIDFNTVQKVIETRIL